MHPWLKLILLLLTSTFYACKPSKNSTPFFAGVSGNIQDDITTGDGSINHAALTTVTLDQNFGAAGVASLLASKQSSYANSILMQPDGNILISGFSYATDNITECFAVAKFTASGTLDSNFNKNGYACTPIDTTAGVARDLALQKDGKIVLAGSVSGITEKFALIRYNSNGSIDKSFGNAGIFTFALSSNDAAYTIKTDDKNNIFVAGYASQINSTGIQTTFALAKITPDGKLDTTFGAEKKGFVMTTIGTNSQANSLAIQIDGKIVLGGVADSNYALARYTAAGILDTAFGNGGIVKPNTATSSEIKSITVLADKSILAAGYAASSNVTANGPQIGFSLSKFLENGSIDNTFAKAGNVITIFSNNADAHAYKMVVNQEGGIYLVGTAETVDATMVAIARFHANGQLDGNFGNTKNGVATVSVSDDDEGYGATLDASGNLLIGGLSLTEGLNETFTIFKIVP